MSKGEIIATIIVAILGVIGTSIGSVLAYMQFAVNRKDIKEEKDTKKLIKEYVDEALEKAMEDFIARCGEIGDMQIAKAKEEMHKEIEEGLHERSKEGKERFEKNSDQIKENTEQIAELTGLVKDQITKLDIFAESMTSLNRVVRASAESQRNFNYDKLLFITNRVLKSGKLTISDKTNIKQLYNSWKDLQGSDPKIDTLVEECMKMTPVPDET